MSQTLIKSANCFGSFFLTTTDPRFADDKFRLNTVKCSPKACRKTKLELDSSHPATFVLCEGYTFGSWTPLHLDTYSLATHVIGYPRQRVEKKHDQRTTKGYAGPGTSWLYF